MFKNKKRKNIKKTEKNSGRKSKPVRLRHEVMYKNLDWAEEVSTYYGFSPKPMPEISADDRTKAGTVMKNERDWAGGNIPFMNLAERISILSDYIGKKHDREPQPVLIAYSANKKSEPKTFKFGLEIIGSPKSIADATVIKTAYEILKEKGYGPLVVSINSMGDRESFSRFLREFINYGKKNLGNLNTACRHDFKKDALCFFSCRHEKCLKMLENAPRPINCLSEPSRILFKEVLEHIEILNIPYSIDNTLLADRTFGCQTIFEIKTEKDGKVLATGARYNVLSRKIGFKKELPAVGGKIELRDFEGRLSSTRKFEKPLVSFVQIGFEAKMKSLQVVEILRQSKIPTYLSLSRDKLSSQLQIAENMKIPYALIMGQKEAMENSVIVRNMANRSQETIPLENLPRYLTKIVG